ncbi:MAG: glycosyltransferase, partial [Candidatus Neomarinimicrobiota bacterium]|nr:glycosyltransferase [Candidatus Neomarinimicrobiota bacterium]
MTSNSVSVIIVSYNVKRYVTHCIETVLCSDYIGEKEIIVVDNNSFDETSQYLRETFPEIKLIENHKNVGFGKAVNHAAETATGEYLLILNPDTILQENTISTFVNYLKTHSEVGLIGPKIINPDGTLQLTCKRSFPTFSVALPKLLGFSKIFPQTKWAGKYNLTYLDPNKIHSVDAVSGSCIFIRKTLFHEIDGFDEQFFLFGEDLDLCFRMKQKGHEIHYVPSTQILHYKGESVKFAPYDSRSAFYNAMILFYKKHFSKSQNTLFRLGIHFGIQLHKFISLITEWRSQILSILLDSAVVFFAFLVTFFLRFSNLEPFYLSHGLIPTIYILFWLIVGTFFQLYGRHILSYSRAALSALTGFFVVVAFTFFFKQFAFSRLVLIAAAGIVTLLIPGWRLITHFIMSRGYINQVKDKHNILFKKKTLVIGANNDGIQIVKKIHGRVNFGLNIIGFVDSKMEKTQEELPVPFLGTIKNIKRIIKTHKIRE